MKATVVELPAHGEAFLAELIGAGQTLADASLEQVLATVPASRLQAHPLICLNAEDRVRHARGQSLPDWLAMRSGDFGCSPMAWPTRKAPRRSASCWPGPVSRI
jgi:alkyldihydroxyacetonephosphate synthase